MVGPNISAFQNAQGFIMAGSEITTVGGNYTKNVYVTSNTSANDQIPVIPPLPPLQCPSTFYTGRDTYMQALKECFSPKLDNERKRFLLYGMGGIGKTQICLEFIEQQYREKWFSDIFWIDASSEHTIDLCLRQIAQKYKMDATPSAESVLVWISDRDNWLMVFDNADGGYQVVEKFIPPGNGGSILITSRDQGLARITSGTCLEVTEMGEDEAISLLLKSAMIDNDSVNVATAAQKLIAALGCIPLAIDQVGAYVMSCGCGLDHYLELFMEYRARLMSDEDFRGASLYNKTTYGTWEISLEAIKCRAEGKNRAQSLAAQSALTLHKILAFLHHDNISEEIFKNAALNFMEREGEITDGLPQSISLLDSKTLFLNVDGKWDALQFEAGIRVLVSFSLIKSNGKLYSVHPLVQTWSRDRIPVANANASDCCKKSKALLACSLKMDYQEDNYRFCRLVAHHIKANDEHAFDCIENEQYFDDQSGRFALAYYKVGDWNQAGKLYSEMVKARGEALGASHPDTLSAMANLASTYWNQGRWNEAESLQVQVMEASKEILGASHPDTLTAMANLASTYWNQGRWNEAESLQVQVMEASKEILGASHPNTLSAMANLASTYWNQGRWNEAESLEVQVMEASKEILGASHPNTLTAMANLALTYRDQGRWNEAESLEVQVMEASMETLHQEKMYKSTCPM
ncbi:P-loop containing nucleoside triphosphate hydrolase protein [Amanita muscaria]